VIYTPESPANYRIKVLGAANRVRAVDLGSVWATASVSEGPGSLITFAGRLRDQTGLIAVLNGLYEMHLSLVSVDRLEDE